MEQPIKTLPVSYAQQRLWFLAQLDTRASAAYHMPGGIRLRGTLDRAALQRALDRIVERHEMLRTCFVKKNGQPRQHILAATGFALHYADLAASPDPEAQMRREAQDEVAAPFDLERGPLIRARLLRLAEHDHVLLVTMHHIVSDGWSMGVLLREVTALYAAFSAGAPDPLPPLPIQYAQYAIWQRKRLAGELLDQQMAFWRTTLHGAPTLLELPTDRPRPPMQDHAGARIGFALDEALSQNLRALSQRHGCTLFMVLLAAWAALLSRLSGQKDLLIGAPMAGRTRRETEPLIGFFVNTLTLRVDLTGAPSVAELLHRVRATTLAAQDHQDLPFEQVIEAVQPVRSLAHNPLFQVMFTVEGASTAQGARALRMPGLALERVHQELPTAEFDLAMTLHEGVGAITGQLVYATSQYDRATIERHIAHYTTLLGAMVLDDGRLVDTLPWLTAQERTQVLQAWNDTEAAMPALRTVHELFEARAESTPHAPALVYEGSTLDYAQLDASANRLAHRLIAMGVRPGDYVALALRRSPQLVIAELAALKCRAAYVPLDPELPVERLRYIVADCSARLLISHSDCPADLADVPRLDADRVNNDGPCTQPARSGHGEDAAYVMYTSGSTGTPKGVVVPHRAVLNLTGPACRDAVIGPRDRVAFASNPAFDSSTLEVWGALLRGATIVVVPQPVLLDPQALADLLRRERVTLLILVAGVLRAYAPVLAGQLSTLRTLVTGGDVADPSALAALLRAGGPQQVLQTYGPTETTQFVTTLALREPPAPGVRIPVGRPIANACIYILDAHGMPVPVGVVGEIHIGGTGVAHGYLNRPELTAERFVPDACSGRPGARLYRTGDLGRWLIGHDGRGTIEFIGRNDQQVKIRGFRIEPGEIEAQLLQHPAVRQAVVLAREEEPGDKSLVAYVIGEEALTAEALRAHLAAHLPEYMVPAAYVQLDALPLTPNGKLDRRALPAPGGEAWGHRTHKPPQGELETALARLWSELLHVEHVGRRDDFFLLGGHSLLAAQLVSHIRMRFGLEVPLAELFGHSTLARFTERVAAAAATALPPITHAARGEPLPLSFAQQRLWFLAQLDERASAAYLIFAGVRLQGALNVAALRAALDHTVARHEALRTRFASVDGAAVQVIAAADEGFVLAEVDLSSHPQPQAHLEHLAAEEARARFDLAHGPLIRGRLLRLAPDDHVLLITMHHIVSDGWSMGVLVNEFSALYAAFAEGRPDPLPALPVQYADYAVWQRRWITGDVLQRQLDFWRAHLSGAPALLELPTDRPRPAVQDHAGAHLAFELDADLSAALKDLGRRHGTTLFMTLLAAWAVLLARLSGQSEVVIGTPVANRTRAEVEPLIGFFVNTLALRVDLSANPTVAALLAQVRASTLAAQAHQGLPFDQVVEALKPMRSLAHSPVFQVMFAWQNAPEGTLALPGLQLQPVSVASTSTQFDLDLSMHEAGDGIAGSLSYAVALFDRATLERHLAHWKTLLRAMAADDSVPVMRLPLLSAADRHQLVQGCNATETPWPAQRCIHELFEIQAARTPDAPALVFEGLTLSYAELNAQANRLAHHLVALGVRPDTRVAVCVPRGTDLMVALLATWKAGGAYVPLDPDYPAERLRYMLADSAPRVLLTDTDCAQRLPAASDVHAIWLDGPEVPWAHLPPHNVPTRGEAWPGQHLAYVFYTSGSTGQPKGVMVEHRSLVNYTLAAAALFQLSAADRVRQQNSINFDLSLEEITPALATGACLHLSRTPMAAGGDPCGASVVHLTAAHWHTLVGDWHRAPELARAQLRAVRLINVTGDALSPQLLAQWAALDLPTRLINTYGPTETTVSCTAALLRADAHGVDQVTIGTPLPNVRVYVLDAHGQPVPIGVAGELCVGGVQVGRGYLDRPQATAERFVPDPYAAEPGSRLYRTGDLVRWRADATLEYLGRRDHQVKVRGFRIELGEIEARLLELSGVREAVVLAREDVPGDKRLVAYVTGESLPPEALRTHLLARLPEYMVPAAYVALDALPLTPNGKLDRRALPAPEGSAFGRRAGQPQGELETLLASLWSQLLGIESIGRHDDFFDLGGHSLLAVQLTSRIRATMGVEVEVAALFEQPTLAGFAQRVGVAGAAQLPPVRPASRDAPLPLSFAQQRLWFLAQLDERVNIAYLMPGGVRLVGVLNVAALQAALNRIVGRHEALRTSFAMHAGHPVQAIAPADTGLPVQHIDLSAHPQPQAELERLAEAEAHTPFDLSQGPLIRGRVVRMAEQDHVLLITLHHIVSDGWSMAVLINELSALYAAFAQGRPDPLPPLQVQYADYAAWQRQWIAGEVLQRQRDFWLQHLRGAPALLELPTDRPRPAVQDYAGASLGFELEEDITAGLRSLCRRHGTTLFMTLLAAWAALLSRLSGQSEVVIGAPVANRHRAETEPLIGLFMNTQALRVDLSGLPTVAELLNQVRTAALAAQNHQDIPFEQVVEALNPPRSLAHSPVCQVLMIWQNTPEGSLELPGLQLEPVGTEVIHAKFDLDVSLQEAGERILGSFQYAAALFDASTIERHVAQWKTLLRALVADDQASVARLPLLSSDEQHLLLHGYNDTAASFPAEQCIHELFEAQVARTPQATALVFEGTSLSYAELNAQANRLAHHLIALGVGPDTRVAIALPRGISMVTAVLATLKAGGAYVPLDVDYPPARLSFMLSDSAPCVLITSTAVRAALGSSWPAIPVVALDTTTREWASLPATHPDARSQGLAPSHLAYVIYTSGSTGQPKGVMVPHQAVVNFLASMAQKPGLAAHDKVLAVTSLSFDIAGLELYLPLSVGACIELASREVAHDGAALARLIDTSGATVMQATPATWRLLLAAQWRGGARMKLLCGGEALPRALADELLARCGELWNLFGPTETTVWSTAERVGAGPVTIGRPIANTRVYVLDASGAPVPVGVPGELYIGGSGVARGYWQRPALTAQCFVPDPHAHEPGARMYRTGDLARCRHDGSIEYLGRRDHQVKIRGFRIELGEIEARLLEHPAVHAAAVLAREDTPGDPRLVAYIVGEPVPPEVLRTHLASALPEYMVPAAYVPLQALPLTPNGKLDRQALPAPDAPAHDSATYEAPQGEVETALAAIWRELLRMERIGRHDNFFALGGHSLLAVSLIERMRALGWQVEVRSLFTSPTLAGIAAVIDADPSVEVPPNLIDPDGTHITPELLPLIQLSQPDIDHIVATVPGGTANVQDIYPLAPLQEGLFFHHLLATEGDTYLTRTLLAFDTRVQLDRFLAALQRVIDRHDILRTAVVWQGLREPVQVVWCRAPLPVEEILLHGNHPADQQLRERYDPLHTRIDLHQAPLLRAHFAHDAQHDRWLLCLLSHHIVGDHTSMELMIEEIRADLGGHTDRLPTPLPFRNFVARAKRGPTAEEHEAFFKDMLADVDEPTAPFGLLDVRGEHAPLEQSTIEVPDELTHGVRAHARRLGVSAASLFHLAWALVLARASGRDDVIFGTVLLGRMQGGEGADRAIGLFMNTLPVRIRLGRSGVEQAVRDTNAHLAQLLPHEHASLALAQRCSQLPASQPLFSALLNYRRARQGLMPHDAAHADDAWRGTKVLHEEERSNYPLCLSVDDFGHACSLDVQVDRRVGAQRIGACMLRALEQLVQALEQAPVTPVRTLDPLPVSERQQVLHGWNATERAYPADRLIHELFEAQAARSPNRVAVVWEDTSLSYAELNAQANRLAHHLIALGLQPDDRIAIALPRSPELLVAILATLKAGAAYVPLDLDQPAERLAVVLQDSAPRVLIAHAPARSRLPALPNALTVLAIDGPDRLWDSRPATNPSVPGVTPGHLAYVIYTSGSTGTPKGVMVPHRAVVKLVIHNGYARFDESDRVAWAANPAFDASTLEMWAPLLHGGASVVIPQEVLLDPQRFALTLQRQAVSVLWLTVGLFNQYASALSGVMAQLRYLIVGGDVLDPRVIADVLRHHPPQHLLNGYGPTETTTFALTHEVLDVPPDALSIPLGRPIANTRVYVLDPHGAPIPVGVAGEIHVGGAGVARGYLHRPELTAERFVPDPFSASPGERLYKTGDLGYWRADGTIEFLRRNDQQLKIRGFRVELGEIEAGLRKHPQVRDAVVAAREDALGDKRLVAYVITSEPLATEALREHLDALLPAYMVPAAYVQLDAFPLTPNGKLDRRALPAPQEQHLPQQASEAPRSGIEQVLAKIWSQVLGVTRVGREDHFFELGGHSLLAVRLIALARQRGLNLTLHDVYAFPTLRLQAQRLVGAEHTQGTHALAARRTGTAPALFALPTGTGDIAYAFELSAHLDAEVPVYALPWPEAMPTSMDALAAHMVELMRAVRPQGPYRLLGCSSGGLLAYAVAQLLTEMDEPVDFVGLLDSGSTTPPVQQPQEERAKEMLVMLVQHGVAQRYSENADICAAVQQLADDAPRTAWPELVARCEATAALRALAAHEQTSMAQFAESCMRMAAYEPLWHGYMAQPLPAPLRLHLFYATQDAPPPHALGWDRLLPLEQIAIVPVPGTHTSMIGPDHIGELGRAVSQALRHARACAPQTHAGR
jgi:amino acid adenylation domain-containing protein